MYHDAKADERGIGCLQHSQGSYPHMLPRSTPSSLHFPCPRLVVLKQCQTLLLYLVSSSGGFEANKACI